MGNSTNVAGKDAKPGGDAAPPAVVAGLTGASILAIAGLCHSVNAAYCRSIGDDSQPGWDDAPDWQRQSAENGVRFHLANPDAGDAASHDSWMAQKLADGWVFGEAKDVEAKAHPCLVPFDQLPVEQQAKDTLFRAVVHAAAPVLEGADAQNERLQEELAAANLEVARVGDLTAANDVLERCNAELKAAADKLGKRGRASAKDAPAKARKIVLAQVADDDRYSARELLDLIGAADVVELVFSDGRAEIAGLFPRVIDGDAWVATPAGLKLTVPELVVHGPGVGAPPYSIAGYGLVLDGDLIAARARADGSLTIGAGNRFELKDDVIF